MFRYGNYPKILDTLEKLRKQPRLVHTHWRIIDKTQLFNGYLLEFNPSQTIFL